MRLRNLLTIIIITMDLGNYKVFFNHTDKGTNCSVRTKENGFISNSIARKSPKDEFSKAKGRAISLTRAVASLPKANRTKIWDDYKKKCSLT